MRPQPLQVCYSQPTDGSGNGVLSQDFGGTPFDSVGADDFILSAPCTITQLVVPGLTSGSTTVVGTFNVTFYYDSTISPGQPGVVAAAPMSIVPVSGPPGTYTLPLPGSGFTAAANTIYWVSVQAANVTPVGDVWYWDTAVVQGYPAVFENPGGAFGTCPTWGTLLSCVGVNSDFAFELDAGTPPCYSQLGPVSKPVNSQAGPGIAVNRVTEAADDFTLTQSCNATSVDVLGTYVGGFTATSFRIRFYKDNSGTPYPITYASRISTGFSISGQTFHLPFIGPPVPLYSGVTYWVSVQAKGLTARDKWRWYTMSQSGNKALWRNPLNGWSTGCTTWTNMQTCHIPGSYVAPDLTFSVNP